MELQNTQPTSELIILTTGQMKNLVSQIIEETKNATTPVPVSEGDPYLTSRQVQDFLKIKRSTMHRFINIGKLQPIRFGRRLLFRKSDLLK